MNYFLEFLSLAVIAFQIYVIAWPALVVGISCTITAINVAPVKSSPHRPLVPWSMLQLLLPIAILAFGAIYDIRGHIPAPWEPHGWPSFLISLFCFAHLPVTVALWWWGKGARGYVLAQAAAATSYSFCASFASEMSVTGRWL